MVIQPAWASRAGIDAQAVPVQPDTKESMKMPQPTTNWDPFEEKRRARRRDRMRLATGKVTVDELQRENAFIRNARACKIVDPNPAYKFV